MFTRPGNKMNKPWQNTIVGRAVVNGERLLVDTNSLARADALRKRIEKAAGARVKYRLRDVRDGRTPRQAATSPTLKPRLVALLKQFEMHEAARPEAERYDVGRLWRALGLDPRSVA